MVSLLFIACKQGNQDAISTPTTGATKEEAAKTVATTIANSKALQKLTSELLVPMEIVEPNSNIVTTKYGLEFGGNCYACDVVNILIDGEMITLMNACDINSQMSYTIESIEEEGKQITIRTLSNTFVFEQVDDYPMYSLKVSGEEIDESMFREASFYTLRSLLTSFQVHDCGDFEG